jgi:clan AA aspartic protease (TIGR02281 family)
MLHLLQLGTTPAEPGRACRTIGARWKFGPPTPSTPALSSRYLRAAILFLRDSLQQRDDERMLGTAYRYLVVVILIGLGFGLIADPELWRSGPQDGSAARGHQARHTEPARAARAADEDEAREDDEDEAWEADAYGDDTYGDDAYEDDVYEDGSYEDESSAVPLEMIIPAGAHGHFLVEAVVEGTPLAFVVDTGASDVVLSPADAERLGLRADELRFTRRYQTANGVVAAAPITLRELRIGQFSAFDVEASVNGAPLAVSLLGMSFLRQLRGYEVDNDRLILRW